MKIEWASKAIDQVREALSAQANPAARLNYGLLPNRPQRFCPRHGSRYVLRRGTNRCPVGRKRKVNCA